MVQTFAKPQPARQLEARARARQLHVRVAVVVPQRHYVSHSQSEAGITYRLDRTRHGWICECRGIQHTGCCKHLAQLERRAEREGSPFGQVAALSQVPGTAADDEHQATLATRRAQALADRYGRAAD